MWPLVHHRFYIEEKAVNSKSDRALRVLQRIAEVWQVDAQAIEWSHETEQAGVGDELQCRTGSGSAILDLVEAANEDGAEIDETLLQPVPRFAVFRPRGVEPPHARVAALRSMGVFAGKGGLADTAEAVHGSGLRDGSCIARVEC